MKKILVNIILGMAFCTLAIFAASCSKDNSNVEDDTGITAQDAENTPCSHSLIHVDAQAPTGEDNGCIEHYECELCGATFSDAAGNTTTITGYLELLGQAGQGFLGTYL